MDMRITNHRAPDPPLRGGDAFPRVLRDGGAAGVVAGAEETHSGAHQARASGPRAAAVYGG